MSTWLPIGNHGLYAETKGRTAALGLDVDTLDGQLLRECRRVAKETTAYEAATPVPLAPSRSRHPSAPAPWAAGAQRRRMQPRPA
jgi:hypothetical protein